MNFGSKYVYNYSDSEEECVSDTEFEEGMTRQHASEEDSVPDSPKLLLTAGGSQPITRGKAAGSGDSSSDDEVCKSAATPVLPDSSVSSPPRKERPHSGGIFGRIFGGSTKRDKKLQGSRTVSLGEEKSKKKMHHWLSSDYSARDYNERDRYDVPQGRRWRRADTNIINVKFDTLKAPSNMHTGDPFHCSSCEAVLSKLSKLEDAEEDTRNWKCEFCGTLNMVDLVDEEIPSAEDTTFMLTPALSTTASGRSGEDETLVIFCVDTSGSMCVTTEVPGKINMRGSRLDRLQSLNDTHESQYLPRQRQDVTYVSRLQGVQAAVDHQLGEMQKEHKNRRVALIAFNNEVTVLGDGTTDPTHISGDKLSNKDEILKLGSETVMPKQVKDTRDSLGGKVFDLEEGGQTALGPALLLSVSMACQIPGSKVIICTDGMANVGLGNLDIKNNDDALKQASFFYDEVSSLAAEKGVSVSVISIKGTDCKMVELGKVADATGGQVNIVDPLKLTQQFGSILADPIIATNVSATLQLHKGLYFRMEESQQSKVTRYVGNVTKQTEVTFEYGVREEFKKKHKKQEKKQDKMRVSTVLEAPELIYDNAAAGEEITKSAALAMTEQANFDQLKEFPFQLQIKYTDLEGAQALRVITQAMPVTSDRQEAEKAMNMAAIGAHATKTSAALALQGEYTPSRLNAFMYQRLLHRKATSCNQPDTRTVYDNFYSNALPMENRMNRMQHTERSRHGTTYSDEEMDDSSDSDECVVAAGGFSMGAVADGPTPAATGHSKKKKAKKALKKAPSAQTSRVPQFLSAPVPHQHQRHSVKSFSRRKECDDESAQMFYQNAQLPSDQLTKK